MMSSADSTWQTPDYVLDLVRKFAPIGLDPCTTEENPVGAKMHFTPYDDWRVRITFRGADDGAPFPSALPYWGQRVWRFREVFGEHGRIMEP